MAEVVLIRWPDEGGDGRRLAVAGVAVLYLVDAPGDPPAPTTCLEDWVRIPGDDRDLSARVAALERRAAAHQAPPRVDDQGRLHYCGRRLTLSPAEARLVHPLIERFGEVVTDSELTPAVANGDPSSPSLRTQMAQLRAQLRPIDLLIRRIRRQGYMLQRR
jgi:DNA-binding response OmpR family regulator